MAILEGTDAVVILPYIGCSVNSGPRHTGQT